VESLESLRRINLEPVKGDIARRMIHLNLDAGSDRALRILCLGAHSDDIEIGCGGTILELAKRYPNSEFQWAVFSAIGLRETEARRAAEMFVGPRLKEPVLKNFPDGFMPFVGADVKTVFEKELKQFSPDLIFTHNRKDAHQDHRLLSELTWNTFRDQLILEYEIPKYDGDLGRPSVFVPLHPDVYQSKVRFIMEAFQSQHPKRWFDEETFLALMRLRGMECNAPSGYAEAFYCRKLLL
jgi:LmbE family N-acetylglucosaminyl deacetylase